MKKLLGHGTIGMLLVFVIGCSEFPGFGKQDSARSDLIDFVWRLESFQDANGERTLAGTEALELVFTEDSLYGRAIPEGPRTHGNIYGGVYETGPGERISLYLRFTTEVGTPPGSRYQEYLQAIRAASSYEIEGDRLRIYYDGKALIFRAKPTDS